MSRLFRAPAPYPDNVSDIADFAELCALLANDGNVSVAEVARKLARGQDPENDTRSENVSQEAFQELEARSKHCGDSRGYPFELNATGTLIQFTGSSSCRRKVYLYLLFATRLNMNKQKHQGGHDGTSVFEELSLEVLKNFIGAPCHRIGGLVFGTSRYVCGNMNSFPAAVDRLCKEQGEGLKFRARTGLKPKKKDAKLDIAAWRGFSDSKAGKLISYAQCKTGTSWRNDLGSLNPSSFTLNWMYEAPAVLPLRAFFVAESVSRNFTEYCADGGVFFDRCRIVDYSEQLPEDLLSKIVKWTDAAMTSNGIALQ